MPLPLSAKTLEKHLNGDVIVVKPRLGEIRGVLERDPKTLAFFLRYPHYENGSGSRHLIRKGDRVLLHATATVKSWTTGELRKDKGRWRVYSFTGHRWR
jgi:hypothetical protein